ncbi:hypothetical protein PVAP13_8KG195103 [Panicum virgatum]|uniref:At2g35280-like TPR domain-containing protein n=1 Tax=Panicum virgatum TaxID=38727 RepID=A0A8T0PJ42_PANVG|nr:hypothetical protein PVAP13_8KG195103 [Panicum virgatum]
MLPTSSLPVLLEEMLVEVAARVAASSCSPMADLRRLRGVCTLVRDKVCGAPLVRCSLNLGRALWQSEDAETSERLMANTYAAGNLEAIFIKGMRVYFGHHSRALQASLDDLDQAAHGGHKPAAYMLAMVLWRANSGAEADLWAKHLLAEVADDDPAIVVCSDRWVSGPHAHAFATLWMFVWPPNSPQPAPMPRPVPRDDDHQCASPRWGWITGWCGAPTGHDGLFHWCYFCSDECRIRSLCDDTFR